MQQLKTIPGIRQFVKAKMFAFLAILITTAYCSKASITTVVLAMPSAGNVKGITSITCTPGDTPTNITIPSNFNQCSNGSTTLTVLATGTINWYASPTSTLSLGTGSAFITPTASPGTYTFYAAATNTCSEGSRTAIQINVIASPTSVAIATVAPACPGASVIMTATGANNYSWSTGAMTATTIITPTTSMTSYTVVGTNSMTGCSQTVTQVANVLSLPTLSVSGAGTICTGQSAVLIVSGANTYTWNNGFMTNSIIATPSMNTTYSVSGTSTVTGCTGTLEVSVVVDPCTGIAGLSQELNGLKVYPNPTVNELVIELQNVAEKNIEISDYTGKTVYKTTSADTRIKLDMSAYRSGIYLLKIHSNGEMRTVKVVKN